MSSRTPTHLTGKGFDIRAGGAYRGADGTVRHVVMIHRPGNGFSLTHSSVAPEEFWRRAAAGLHCGEFSAILAMGKFKRWAQAEVVQQTAASATVSPNTNTNGKEPT